MEKHFTRGILFSESSKIDSEGETMTRNHFNNCYMRFLVFVFGFGARREVNCTKQMQLRSLANRSIQSRIIDVELSRSIVYRVSICRMLQFDLRFHGRADVD